MAKLPTVIAASILMPLFIGCHFTETAWSTERVSPDGKWVAMARTDNTDTIGNVEYTIVSLKHAGFWHRPHETIVFDGIDYPTEFHLNWVSASQLEIQVPADTLVYQQNKVDGTDGLTITVRHVEKPQVTSSK